MATTPPPLTPDQQLALEQKQRYTRFARNAAIGGVILCPVIAFLPPRKLDLYTFSLAIGFYLSADHLSNSYNGRGLLENAMQPLSIRSLPTEKAMETQRRLEQEKQMEQARQALREGRTIQPEQGTEKKKGILHKVWMGGEEEDWKERRMAEERKALEEGKSYTSIILDQIVEVWNWDKKKDGQGDGNDAQNSKDGPKK